LVLQIKVILSVAFARWSACLQGNSESCNISAPGRSAQHDQTHRFWTLQC
jgi:surfactin synthase thioesterase subunit